MTMAMRAVQVAPPTGPKVLRIGLIQSGKIVEERIVRKRETVSVGTSEKNHFIVQAPGLPSRFDIFQLIGNDYILNFTDQMKGRVALPAGVQDLDTLRATGGARNAGTHWQVKLNESSRGKVVFGNTTLLFQFVVPPPVQPRPQLPAAARGGFVKGIDWMFTAFVVFSYMIFFGFLVYLESADWPIDEGIAAIPDDLSRFIFDEPPPPAPPSDEVTEISDEGEEEAAEESSGGGPSKNTGRDAAAAAAEGARIGQDAQAQAEALLLGALGEGGALADVLAGGAVVGNSADVLAQAQGVGVANSQGGTMRQRGGGGGSGQGGLGGLQRAGGEGVTAAAGEGETVVERVIRGRVNFGSGDAIGGSGDFDSGLVVQMIRGRQSAFRRCYETSLRNNPTLAGRVAVRFTIQPAGNVAGAQATENSTGDAALASCVVRVISGLRWRQGPEGGSVTFSYPFIFAPQN